MTMSRVDVEKDIEETLGHATGISILSRSSPSRAV